MKFNEEGNVLTKNIKNGYSIKAIYRYLFNSNCYYVELYLNKNDINIWDFIGNIRVPVVNNISPSVVKQEINKLITENYFQKYIDRYELLMECFDIEFSIKQKEWLDE